jgi:hypothetical protein
MGWGPQYAAVSGTETLSVRGGFGVVLARSLAGPGALSVSGEHGAATLARLGAVDQRSIRDVLGGVTPGPPGSEAVSERSLGGPTVLGPPGSDMVIQRFLESTPSSEAQWTGGDDDGPGAAVGASSGPISAELLERIIDALEERVLLELERRGLRHSPEVF